MLARGLISRYRMARGLVSRYPRASRARLQSAGSRTLCGEEPWPSTSQRKRGRQGKVTSGSLQAIGEHSRVSGARRHMCYLRASGHCNGRTRFARVGSFTPVPRGEHAERYADTRSSGRSSSLVRALQREKDKNYAVPAPVRSLERATEAPLPSGQGISTESAALARRAAWKAARSSALGAGRTQGCAAGQATTLWRCSRISQERQRACERSKVWRTKAGRKSRSAAQQNSKFWTVRRAESVIQPECALAQRLAPHANHY